ncbi:MAG: DNA internalization-related competence protein ComEC/Rec2 [Polyangiaceae bacterium]
MRVDSLVVLGLALALGSASFTSPAVAALLLVALAALGGSRALGRAGLLLLLLAFAFGAASSRIRVQHWDSSWHRARAALREPARCAGEARVVSSPTRHSGVTSFSAELEALDCEGRALPALVARLHGGPEDLRRGDRLDVVVELAPIELYRNADLPDARPSAARRVASVSGAVLAAELQERGRGIGSWIDALRNRARRGIDAAFVPSAAPLARALVLGESDLDPEDDSAFRRSGLSHLLAVSGTHLVFAVVALVKGLGALLLRIESLAVRCDVRRIASAAGIGIALAYADFAGGSGSAWRAAWMLAVAFLARALSRRPRPDRMLGASLIIGALVDPLIVYDVSFLLSGAATVGLIALGGPFGALAERVPFRPLAYLARSVATTLAAMVPCLPLLALFSPEQTVAGLFANTLAAPIGEAVALPLCLLHPVLGGIPYFGAGLALVGSGALLWVRGVAKVSASLRFLAFPVPVPTEWHLALLALVALGAWLRPPRWRFVVAGAVALVALELGAIRAGNPRGELRVSVLDIGQGDSLLVDLPDGSVLLVDAGGSVGGPDPGARVIAPLLRMRRRSRVDVVVISHPHPDHFGGMRAALERVDVGELWDTGQGEAEGAGPEYAALLAELRKRGVRIRRPPELCGEHRFGEARLEVLAPCPAATPNRNANDNSFVLRVSLGRRRALLVGDAEREEEHELARSRGEDLRADFLKIGHHGSRTSSSAELLSRVAPAYAAISCGVRNHFGHPHRETLESLRARGIHTLRTDLLGSIQWQTDGEAERVVVGAAARQSD